MAEPKTSAHAAPSTSLSPRGRMLLWVGGLLAGVAAFYGGLLVGSNSDIPANTNVLGVQIGGLSTAEATAVLERELGPVAESAIAISAYDDLPKGRGHVL